MTTKNPPSIIKNLQEVDSAELQAHLDQMNDSELFFVRLQAGEVLAGRDKSASIIAHHVAALRVHWEALYDHYNAANGLKG